MQQLSFTYSQYLFAISKILFFSLKVTGICQSLFIGGVGLLVYLSFVAIKKIKNKKNIYGLVGGQYILYICRYRVDLFIHITSKGF